MAMALCLYRRLRFEEENKKWRQSIGEMNTPLPFCFLLLPSSLAIILLSADLSSLSSIFIVSSFRSPKFGSNRGFSIASSSRLQYADLVCECSYADSIVSIDTYSARKIRCDGLSSRSEPKSLIRSQYQITLVLLLPLEKLTSLGNFNTRRRSMMMTLGARNKVVSIDGTFPVLEKSHLDYAFWFFFPNILVSTWIVNDVDKSIAKSIMYLGTARQMWLDIHDQFNSSRVMDRGLHTSNNKDLRGLKEKRQWSMKHDQATSAVAFQASQVNQQSDSVIAADYGVYNKQKNRPIYSHCGIACHTDNRCYKLHGYPTSW
ncbi:hypothetical protein YC2023_069469 [Brassica napus]